MLGRACCCQGCEISEDDFNRADNSNITTGSTCGWTKVSGTSAIVSNSLSMTANNTLVTCDLTDSSGGPAVKAQADVTFAATDDIARLVIKATGASDYWCIEAKCSASSGNIRIVERSGGSDNFHAIQGINYAPGTYTLKVCYGDGGVQGQILSGSTVLATVGYGTTTTNTTNNKAGLLGKTVTGTMTFDNFTYDHGYDVSVNRTCEHCVCNGIHDIVASVVVSPNAYTDSMRFSLAVADMDTSGGRGGGNIWIEDIGGGWTPFAEACTIVPDTAPAATAPGDVVQIAIVRSGGSCAPITGTFLYEDFSSGTFDPSWGNTGWTMSAGMGRQTGNFANGALTIPYFCVSTNAIYDILFCVNGIQIAHVSAVDIALTSTSGTYTPGVGNIVRIDTGRALGTPLGVSACDIDDLRIDFDL